MPLLRRHPCGGFGRRQFLAGAAAVPALLGLNVSAAEPKAAPDADAPGKLGAPGAYPGRVVEVRNPAMIKDGVKDRDAIKATAACGMSELTGAGDAVEAWRTFFEPGDVVGIKMNSVGNPLAISSAELMLEVIEGLKAPGVKAGDMFVFDRYKGEFMAAGMHIRTANENCSSPSFRRAFVALGKIYRPKVAFQNTDRYIPYRAAPRGKTRSGIKIHLAGSLI